MTRPLLQVLRAPQTYPALPVLRTAEAVLSPFLHDK